MTNNNFYCKTLNFAHVNIASLPNKIDYVHHFLLEHSVSILGITESCLMEGKHNEASITIPNYKPFRRDANFPLHKGICTYIRNDLVHCVKRRPDLEIPSVECMWWEVPSCPNKVLLGFMYRNPKHKLEYDEAWCDDFVQMMMKVSSGPSTTVLMGDFNINLMINQTEWIATTETFGLHQLINIPTRVEKRKDKITRTLIDHIYTNNPNDISKSFVSDICLSDHKPIICTWSGRIQKYQPSMEHTYVMYRSVKHFNEDKFCDDLCQAELDHLVLNSPDAESASSAWVTAFVSIVDKHFPLRKRRVKSIGLPDWLTPEIKEAMRKRDQLKKDKRRDDYKKQRNKVNDMITKSKIAFSNKIVTDSKDISQVWRAMNELSHVKRTKKSPGPNIKFSPEEANVHFLSAIDKILGSGSHFADCPTESTSDNLLPSYCKSKLKPTDSFKIPFLSVTDVIRLITKLNNKTTMGSDGLNSKILKTALPCIAVSVTILYNRCIEEHMFPSVFKEGKVIPLPKCRDASSLNDFRLISILPILSKPLEKHIHQHLLKYMEDNHLFYEYQSGFRPHHSCHTALIRLCNSWLEAINNHEVVGAVFLDLRKAFDLVDHNLLTGKLAHYFQDVDSVRFFGSYLSNRSQKTYINGSFSTPGYVKCGVPQGSILGPLLFCIFINDLPLHIKNKAEVNLDLFADDSSLSARNKDLQTVQHTLQNSLTDVSSWCKNNKMALNPQKSKSMVVATRQKHQLCPLTLTLTIGSESIEQVNVHRVLGVLIDDKFSWHDHIDSVLKRVSRNLFLLNKLSHCVNKEALKAFFLCALSLTHQLCIHTLV